MDEEKLEKRRWGLGPGKMMIDLVLEDEKGRGAVDPIAKKEINGGSTMPLCSIDPPPSKETIYSYTMMFSPLAHAHSHEPHKLIIIRINPYFIMQIKSDPIVCG